MRATSLPPQVIGILSMSAAGAVFSAHDAITKYLAATYPLGEIIFFRQLAASILLVILIRLHSGPRHPQTRQSKGQIPSRLFSSSPRLC